jgi:multidrug transporter EmrE-like cation transporter
MGDVVWYLLAATAAAVPIPLIKQYTLTNDFIWVILSIISYFFLVFAYVMILSTQDIASVYPFLKVLSVLIVVASGLLFFNSTLDIATVAGILLGAASLYLLSSKV